MSYKQRVLIVDDEPRNQRILLEVLEEHAELKVTGTGEEALACFDEFQPDLVLLDIMMPGIDGYEVCKRIKGDTKGSRAKVILVSGRAMVEERLKGYEVGADDYVTKPFEPDELLAKARVYLRLCHAERRLAELNEGLEREVEARTAELLETQASLMNVARMSALGEMAAGIAHEINTPLATIGLAAERIKRLLESQTPDVPAASKMAGAIWKTVQRIGSIVQGLRTFSRDGSKDRFEPAKIQRIVDDSLGLCRERIMRDQVEIRVEPIAEDIRICCQPVQISQVLLNLISNSCDAIAQLPEKWIGIRVEQDAGNVVLTVTDSGKGIPEAVRKKMFQPFFTTKEIGKGTGLGLGISKGIVESHQGTLTIDAQSPNTCFVIRLPLDTMHCEGEESA